MRELRLIGPGEDGESVIVESDAGEQFSLPVDERLRAAARSDRAHLGQLDAAITGPLRPRDIQIRVRAGESPADLAEQAGMPLDRVMRFAYPVLAERTRVTDEARRARARRVGDGHLVAFGELVDSRFAAHGIEPGAVTWDAFRRPDGGWTVTANVPDERFPALAKFSFSLGNRTVSALDDVAADLLSGRPIKAQVSADPPTDRFSTIAFGRLSAVPDEVGARLRARTHPLPVEVDDQELFDQDALDSDGFEYADPSARPGSADGTGRAEGAGDALADAEPELLWPQPGVEPGAFTQPDAEEPSLFAERTELGEDAAVSEHGEEPVTAGSGRRGAKHGDKPRMPSWDDILLGVRRKSE